ncbi:MAG: DNA primase [Gammaproteobacteria bacterium]|nr:DNA primase [Gammaproteobacteria bacterium]
MAGLIPQHFIDELLTRTDIVEVINSRAPLKKAGHEYKACCPFHDEKTPSFTVSPGKQFYHCFGCGAHGTALGFLMEHDHMSFVEAIEELASMNGLEVPREEGAAPARSNDDLYQVLGAAADFYQSQLKDHAAAIAYLKGRGLTGQIAVEFCIGFAPDSWDALLGKLGKDEDGQRRLHLTGMVIERDGGGFYDRFRNRVMFPIRDTRGRFIGFGGRVLGEGEPKYLNSPETPLFKKGEGLYGLYEARQALRDIPRLLVVEGYMDVVGLAQHGIRYGVATLGTATTVQHLKQLFRVSNQVVFCFDGDRAGRAAAWRALENALPEMREGRDIRFLFLPDGEDPDSLVRAEGRAAFEKRIDGAMPFSEYLVKNLSDQVDMDSVEGRAAMAESARPLLGRIPTGVYREMLTQTVADAVGMAPAALAGVLSEESQRVRTARQGRTPVSRAEGRSTLARRAIGHLLANPHLAVGIDVPPALAESAQKGHQILVELIAQGQATPGLNTAALLERWRERPEGEHLQKLLHQRLDQLGQRKGFSPEGLKQEFKDLITRIGSQLSPERERILLAKMADEGLSSEEKEELRALHVARSEAPAEAGNEASGA